MEIEVTTTGNCRTLKICGEMSTLTARQLQAEVTTGIELCQVLTLDLSGVTEMDSAGLQLLIAAEKSARKKHKVFSLAAPSQAVLTVLKLNDLACYFTKRMSFENLPTLEASCETDS